jgi:hypothetical protein
MPNELTVLEKVNEYSDTYRNPGLTPFKISDRYSFFPSENTPDPKWPQPYPNGKRQGVYLIFDEDMSLLYVGKASMSNTLESRLSAYFTYEADKKSCRILKEETWSKRPRYLITIAVPDGSSFEAPALEEFLIKSFGNELPDNKIGTAG